MHCIQEKDSSFKMEEDPLAASEPASDSDEPDSKRPKLSYTSPSLNLQVYQIPAYSIPKSQIPAFSIPKSLSIFPSTSTLPKFVNNPLNLANPLALAAANRLNVNNLNSLHKRYSLPAKLSITSVTPSTNGLVRYKKNGEIAKKRGPPKGYKRKPKLDTSLPPISNGVLTPAQNALLNSLLAKTNTAQNVSDVQKPHTVVPSTLTIIPRVEVPKGVELVELDLDPADFFPDEPYKMVFSRKKNPKWKEFPYRCEHCFKGYRVASTLLTHAAARHGAVPSSVAVPCPCCPHVSIRRKQHSRHLVTHEGKRHRIFCPYCLPPTDPTAPYVKESEKYPYDEYPQYWYASEESLRLHKKRKHPYSAMYNNGWRGAWGPS